MDNLRIHHIQAMYELIHDANVEARYLPPYSPDPNPIEKLWSKVKTVLRKMRIRALDALGRTIHTVSALSVLGTEL